MTTQQITPSDVTAACKLGTDWMDVVSWPGVQDAAQAALNGLRRLELSVAIAKNEKLISVTGMQIAGAEADNVALRAELDLLDSETAP